jgi:glycerophosphoryl diester phosphodiesterase
MFVSEGARCAGRVTNWAHRGARSVAPENTLEAARKGLELGADGWELDVRFSADGRPFLMHDLGMLRTTDIGAHPAFELVRPKICTKLTLARMQSLSFGKWFRIRDPFGTVASEEVGSEDLAAYDRAGVVTLEEALLFSREHGFRVNVELKDMQGWMSARDVVDRVAGIFAELDMDELVLVSSFSPEYLGLMQKRCPGVRTGLLVGRSWRGPVQVLRDLGVSALHPHFSLLDTADVHRMRDARIDINVYTVNDPEEMKRQMCRGVTGIITDYPQRLGLLIEKFQREGMRDGAG